MGAIRQFLSSVHLSKRRSLFKRTEDQRPLLGSNNGTNPSINDPQCSGLAHISRPIWEVGVASTHTWTDASLEEARTPTTQGTTNNDETNEEVATNQNPKRLLCDIATYIDISVKQCVDSMYDVLTRDYVLVRRSSILSYNSTDRDMIRT